MSDLPPGLTLTPPDDSALPQGLTLQPQAQPTELQKAVASPAGSFTMGAVGDTVLGSLKPLVAAGSPEGLVAGISQAASPLVHMITGQKQPNFLDRFSQSVFAPADTAEQAAEKYYQSARQATGQTGTDWGRLSGDIASLLLPMPGGKAEALEKLPAAVKFAADAVPSVKVLKGAAQDAYRVADNSGMLISNEALQNLVSNAQSNLADFAHLPEMEPKTAAAFSAIKKNVDQGNPMTLQGLDALRKYAGKAATTIDKQDRTGGRILRDTIDDFVSNLDDSQVIGNVDQNALDSLSNARDLWHRASKGEIIDNLIGKAQSSMPDFSAIGFDKALQTQFRKLVNSDRGMARFSPTEQQAFRDVVRGNAYTNAMRVIGRWAPTGPIAGASAAVMGHMLAGTPGAAALGAGALGAKYLAGRATGKAANLASEIVRNGGIRPLPPPPAISNLRLPSSDTLALPQRVGILGSELNSQFNQ